MRRGSIRKPASLLGLLLFVGCGSSSGRDGGAAGVVENRAPGGTLVAPANLRLEVAPEVSPPRPGLALVAAWDVTPKAETTEAAALTFRFDPKTIDAERLSAWAKEPDGNWAMVAAEIDPVAGRATLRAEHFSLYAWYVWGDSDFDLQYYTVRLADGLGVRHPKHGASEAGYLRFGMLFPKLGGKGPIDREVIEVVEDGLARAAKRYVDLGYRVPRTGGFFCDIYVVVEVRVTGTQEPLYAAKPTQGHIELPISPAADPAARAARAVRLRHDIAHELFHAIEDQYYSWPAMVAERWWVEAAAEYAASQVVGPAEVGELAANWPAMALDATDDDHMYASGHFLRWLAAHHGLSVVKLLEETASSTDRMVESLDGALDGKLAERFRDFLAWVWFDSGFAASDYAPTDPHKVSPSLAAFGFPTLLPTEVRGSGRPVGPDQKETKELSIPGPYGATLWEILPQFEPAMAVRNLEVEVDGGLPPRMELCLFRAPGNARVAGGITPACMTAGASRSPQVRVQPGDRVYALLVNELMPRTVSVRVGDAIDAGTRRQPIGVGDLTLSVPEWLVVAEDRQTALTLTTRVAPSFTSMVALAFPGASDDQVYQHFQGLMRAVQQPGMVPAHSDPRVEVDAVELFGRTVPYRRVTFTLTGSFAAAGRHYDATGKGQHHKPGDPWQREIEYQAVLWSDGQNGLILVARGSAADREVLRRALLSLASSPDPCQEKNGGCDVNASCARADDGSARCTCRAGYQGDGLRCEAVADQCNRELLEQRVAVAEQEKSQNLGTCKDSGRAAACEYQLAARYFRDLVQAMAAGGCSNHLGIGAGTFECWAKCAMEVSSCLDQGGSNESCGVANSRCRDKCRKTGQ